MRIVKHNEVTQDIEGARLLERQGATEKDRDLYIRLLKNSPDSLEILDRLIIIYRRLKQPKKEIQAINREIRILEKHHTNRTAYSSKVKAISKKLNLMLKHTDRKGKNLLVSPQVLKLQKRKKLLQDKL